MLCRTVVVLLLKLDLNVCAECGCDPVGSTSSKCDQTTGQCDCVDHVTGRSCDRCEDNFVNLSSTGCTGIPSSLYSCRASVSLFIVIGTQTGNAQIYSKNKPLRSVKVKIA